MGAPMRARYPVGRRRWFVGALILTVLSGIPGLSQADHVPRDLSGTQQGLIYGASVATLAVGRLVSQTHFNGLTSNRHQPNAVDRWMRALIHGGTDTVSNFLDNHFGSMVTPGAALITISLIDIGKREFSRDVPFFLAGLAATKGITGLSKTMVRRPRPYCLDGGCPPPNLSSDDPYHRRSFISGHTSSAFYAASFFNNRFRRYMRRNWTRDEYKVGRWASPAVSFGWATVVGLSRIHADKHYFTDVLAGALVGTALAEIYYHLAYKGTDESSPEQNLARRRIGLTLRFAL